MPPHYIVIFLVFSAICLLEGTGSLAWVRPVLLSVNRPNVPSRSKLRMVESLTLEDISDNHDEVGQELADSLQRMLDTEWMPQEVHARMAASVKQSYVNCRESGEADLMAIMTTTADDLMEKWNEYDKDAFVNAWDISNYVSDFLTSKTGVQGCECTQKIY